MSKYGNSLLTNQGMKLATQAANGKTNFTITRAASTADDLSKLSEDALKALTAIPHEVQDGDLNTFDDDRTTSDNILGTDVTFNNQDLTQSYAINAIGLYAQKANSSDEILYCIVRAEDPETLPDFNDGIIFQFKMSIYVVVGSAAKVTVSVDSVSLASKEYVNQRIETVVDAAVEDMATMTAVNQKIADTTKDMATNASVDQKLKTAKTDLNTTINKTMVKGAKYKTSTATIGTDRQIDLAPVINTVESEAQQQASNDLASKLTNMVNTRIQSGAINATTDLNLMDSSGNLLKDYAANAKGNKLELPITDMLSWFEDAYGAKTTWVGLTDGESKAVVNVKPIIPLADTFQIMPMMHKRAVKGGYMSSPKDDIPVIKSDVAIQGYYAVSIDLPIVIKKSDLKVGVTKTIDLKGIGENLNPNGKKSSPTLKLTLKDDGSLDVDTGGGYDLDNQLADKGSGQWYNPEIMAVRNFNSNITIVSAPSNTSNDESKPNNDFLANGTVLWSGNSSGGTIPLKYVKDDLSNIINGFSLNFDQTWSLCSDSTVNWANTISEIYMINTDNGLNNDFIKFRNPIILAKTYIQTGQKNIYFSSTNYSLPKEHFYFHNNATDATWPAIEPTVSNGGICLQNGIWMYYPLELTWSYTDSNGKNVKLHFKSILNEVDAYY